MSTLLDLARTQRSTPDLPILEPHQMAALEANFPPRCIGAKEDPVAAHRYAGMVDLVARLRAVFEEHHKQPEGENETEADEFDPHAAQRAQ